MPDDFFSQLGAMFGGGQQPPPQGGQPAAPQNPYGLPDDLMQQARMQAFGNVGAQLLSAAQPQSRDQRAQAIGQIGQAANPQAYLNQAQQMLMRQTQMREAQRKMHIEELRDKAIQTPEFRDAFKQTTGRELTPSMIQLLGPDGLDQVARTFMTTDPEEKRLRIAKLRSDVEHAGEFNLGIGQTRFGAGGQKIAENKGGNLDAETIDFIAHQILLKGDQSGLQNVGRGAQGSENIAAIRNRVTQLAKDYSIDPTEASNAIAGFAGQRAGEAAAGKRIMALGLGMKSAEVLAPQVLATSAKVNRTEYPTVNAIIEAGLKQQGDPNIVRFGIALNSFINTYARAIGGGTLTVSGTEHARQMLQEAYSRGQIEAGVDQLMKELQAEMTAPAEARKELQQTYAPTKGPGAAAAPPASSPAASPSVVRRYNPATGKFE